MILDNLTACVVVWGAITAFAIVGVAACDGCCIAKLFGKPCSPK